MMSSSPVPKSPTIAQRLSSWVASPFFWWTILALGVAVRCRQYFSCQSYWYDESYFILTIRERGFGQLLGFQPHNLVIPPVYLWITRWLYELGGQGELLMRLPAFLAGIADLFMMALLARLVAGRRHGVWALAFLASCRHAILHGCEVRPYTTDLLFVMMILYCTAALLDPSLPARGKKWMAGSLIALAFLSPWTSFPSVFLLGAASLALAIHYFREPSRRGWMFWIFFNASVCISSVGLWWLSNRYINYPGMKEHWGAHGWGGFPDWNSFPKICKWVLTRPLETGDYGNRQLGIILTLLAILGGCQLIAKRSTALLALLAAPFFLAVIAGLLGKYPLADRTEFFLLPCLWLLAVLGIGGLVEWGGRHGREFGAAPALLIVCDFFWIFAWLVRPDTGPDYRGAYRLINARRQPDDMVWPAMGVVYETYYGKDPHVFNTNSDTDFYSLEQAVQMTGDRRLWVFIGKGQPALLKYLGSQGRKIAFQGSVTKGDILLLDSKKEAAPAPQTGQQ